jgi:Spy/CpxP family protein refolding chaperone
MRNKYKWWVILSLLVAFAAGLLGGMFSERYFFHRKRVHSRQSQRGADRPPDLERMAEELGLSAEQKAEIKKIFEGHEARLRELRSEMDSRLSGIRSEMKSQIDTVLTPEQKRELEAIIARHREQRKKESEQRRRDFEKEGSRDRPKGEMR